MVLLILSLMTHVDSHDGQVNVIEQLIVVLHRHAGREEHHQLLLTILLQKREEQQETFLWRTYNISLKRTNHMLIIKLIFYTNNTWPTGADKGAGQVRSVPVQVLPQWLSLCCHPLQHTVAPSWGRCAQDPPPYGSVLLKTTWSVFFLEEEKYLSVFVMHKIHTIQVMILQSELNAMA